MIPCGASSSGEGAPWRGAHTGGRGPRCLADANPSDEISAGDRSWEEG
jgi:hypothetical protein